MTWAKLDDAILDNVKIAKAGALGFALHVAGITWCCRNLTDGFIPYGRVWCLLDMSVIFGELLELMPTKPQEYEDRLLDAALDIGPVQLDKLASKLVAIELWEEVPHGYQIHDFLDYNPTKERVMAERARGAERKQSSRNPESVRRMSQAESARTSDSVPVMPRVESESASLGPVPVPVPLIPKSEREPSAPESQQRIEPYDSDSGIRATVKTSRKRPATGLPDEEAMLPWLEKWKLTDALHGPLFARFLDYHRSKGSVFVDWAAAWRTWQGNETRFAGRTLNAVQPTPVGGFAWKVGGGE